MGELLKDWIIINGEVIMGIDPAGGKDMTGSMVVGEGERSD